jgi:uncharacterized membrane protein
MWSLYWGVQVVYIPIKCFYAGLWLFTTAGILDLFLSRILISLSMYLIIIPIFGIIVGALGGAFYMQAKHARIAKVEDG